METLEEINKHLSGDTSKDLELLSKYIFLETNTEEEYFEQIRIAKFMKQLACENKNYVIKYKSLFEMTDLKFLNYILKKLKLKKSKRQWQQIIYYVDKIFEVFVFTPNDICFDTLEDAYLYAIIFNNPNINIKVSIEGYAYAQKAMALYHLNEKQLAIEYCKKAIKTTPMSFEYYEQLFNYLVDIKDFDDLKKYLDLSHKIIKSAVNMGTYLYFYGLYFYYTNNFGMFKYCSVLAVRFSISLVYNNKLNELFEDLKENQTVITPFFNIKAEDVLKTKSVKTWYSQEIMTATLLLYQKCLTKEINDKYLENFYKKSISLFNLKDYAKQCEVNHLTEYKMFNFPYFKFCFKLKKDWQVIFNSDNNNTETMIFNAVNCDKNLTVFIDKQIDKEYFDNYTKINENTLIYSGFKKVYEKKFITLKNKEIYLTKYSIGDKYFALTAFVLTGDNFFTNFTLSYEKDEIETERVFNEIVSSIENFNTLMLR